MGLLSHLFFLHILILVSIAYIELPIKQFRDGSKSSFIQAPYISTVRDQTVKEIQEEITNSWPEGIITYYLDDKSYDLSVGDRVRSAMSAVEAATCIRFRVEINKPEGNISWIHITNPNKRRQCVHDTSFVNKGEIMLVLGYDCLQQEQLIHSLLHGIGFKDEVTHSYRDKYIKVLWDNIQPDYRYLYKIQPVETSRAIVEYDPLSIMHFHDRAFSSNGKATIVPLEPGLNISPSESLSQLDKMRLQLYFGHECNKRKFSSLVETCRKSLKDEHEISQDDQDKPKKVLNNVAIDNKESEKSIPNTEDNVESVSEQAKENSDENDEPTNNKKDKDEADYSEENNLSVNREDKDNSKPGDGSDNSNLGLVTTLNGLLALPKDDIINGGVDVINTFSNIQKTEESGVNLNYETDEN